MNRSVTNFVLGLSLLIYGLPGMAIGDMHQVYVEVKIVAVGNIAEDKAFGIDFSEKKTKVKATCYSRLLWNGVDHYTGNLVCEIAPDIWAITSNGLNLTEIASPVGAGLSQDDFVTFTNAKGQVIEGYGNHFWKPKIDKHGKVKMVTGKTLGSEMISNSTADPSKPNQFLLGEYSYKGKMIKNLSKIPVNAFALLP